MPCMELFDKQPEDYRKDIIEQEVINCYDRSWKYYIMAKILKNKGANFRYRSIWRERTL